jgi:tetratricopeptide (TPR) repeat protein
LALAGVQENMSYIHMRLLSLTSFVLAQTGDAPHAIEFSRRVRQISELLGDHLKEAEALVAEAQSWRFMGDLPCARALLGAALGLCPSGYGDTCKQNLANLYLVKTEYRRAQELALEVLDHITSQKPLINNTTYYHILLAVIGIETGAEPDHIRDHIEAACLQFNSSVVWPIGLILCDKLMADLHLC